MNRFFVIGDTHGSIELKKLSHKNFRLGRELDYTDIICILGDAGFIWDNSAETRYWDDWAEKCGFTIIAIKGNHENYNAINQLPIEKFYGANVRRVRPHIMYVENGEILHYNNMTFLCMGGAASHDKWLRKENINWWPQEIPSKDEMLNCVNNVEKANFKVDYILSHCAPNFIHEAYFGYERNELTTFHDNYINNYVIRKAWFFGHYHQDKVFTDNYICSYNHFWQLFPDCAYNYNIGRRIKYVDN